MSRTLFALALAVALSGCAKTSKWERIAPSKDYPLSVCAVTGEKLGSMGDPVAIRYEGREVQFCCEGCVDEFVANPKAGLARLDAAK